MEKISQVPPEFSTKKLGNFEIEQISYLAATICTFSRTPIFTHDFSVNHSVIYFELTYQPSSRHSPSDSQVHTNTRKIKMNSYIHCDSISSLNQDQQCYNFCNSLFQPLKVDIIFNETFQSESLAQKYTCLLYTSPSPRDLSTSRMPSSA